jgi:serine/threonine protein kinase/tetratricopeptide (TPR) repeat protein
VISQDPRRGKSGTGSEAPLLPGVDALERSFQAGPLTRLIAEFAAAWGRGERPPAEAFFDRHPRLTQPSEAAIRLIYEEVCLRQREGQEVTLSELIGRFPQWRTELEVLLDCDRLLGAMPGPPDFPAVEETLGDFLLLAELGRGAKGRCFLAAQPSLSYRQVVLKITADDHIEHLSMARLQHTHIMPLYSEHAFADRRIRALCMPYLGGTTLARILAELSRVPADRRSGQSFLDVLDRTQQSRPWPQSRASPSRRFLAQASHVQAICWIGACLADALQYAHDRGLVHMDVKPSNILLSADGQPMLLDFHLAREPIPKGELPADGVGGTPGYMSPEQEARITARESAGSARPAVDARSDLYSLGRVLAEMLGAEYRPAAGSRPFRSGSVRSEVSTGLADLIRKCLAPDPNDRYPDGSALAEDLRRHMADQPLRFVPNRSLRERWRKWCRRQPYELFRVKTFLVVSCAAVAIAVVVWAAFLAPRFRAAGQSLIEGRVLLDRRDYPQAARTLTRGAAFIEGLPGSERLSQRLAAALRLTDRLEEVDYLHRLVDRLRFAESSANIAVPSAREVERHCHTLWESRRSLLERPGVPIEPQLEQRLRDDLLDLAVIASNLRVRLETDPKNIAAAHRTGLRLLDEAEELFGPSHVLYCARRSHAGALGLVSLAAAAAHSASELPPRTAWEHDAAGRVLLATGDFAQAEVAFERALVLQPQEFWPNFHQGMCAFRLGRYQDAVNAFRVCIALAPDRAECFYNRALAHAVLGHTLEASRDYDRAISLDPALAMTPLDRNVPHRPPAPSRSVAP